ncbi:MAG: DUF802 domain-containing protein [Rubrivivax sp.]|nr:MAG: DUF802 domain-containing protein [Rubrivivax sp.]
MNKVFRHATVIAGLAVIAWVGAGYVAGHGLALGVTLLIGAFYLMGVLELHRFQKATAALVLALEDMAEPLTSLRPWLDRVPAPLQNAVRRRIEGEPVGLPGPAMASTLAGLLVLLGMLGTFLGMVVTLRGTGLALEGATDLVSVRNALVAPVHGLGLAFGTSVAGVAASAALGLLAALSRRERVQVAQRLNDRIATTLRVFSVVHQRETSLSLLQKQAELMPALVDGLRAMMESLERQAEASNVRLLDSQARFHDKAEAAYAGLASAVAHTLQTSLTDSARIAGDTIRPVAEATLAGVARETASLHAALAATMQGQLDQLSSRFEASTTTVAEAWQTLLARHERTGDELAGHLHASHDRLAQAFEQRSAALLDQVAQRHVGWQGEVAAALSGMTQETASMQASVASAVTRQLDGVAARLDGAVLRVTDHWDGALAQHARVSEQVSKDTQQSLATAAAAFEQHSASLLGTVQQAHVQLQSDSAQRDQQRVDAMAQSLEAMAASLRREWQEAGAQTLAQQQSVCETLERTAREITAQSEAQVRHTSAEITRLVQAASEAPRAAAEVITELRQKLSDSIARDNTLLDERARMLDTLGTLLDGVNRAATEQRGAIDAMVASSSAALESVGARFSAQVDREAGKLAEVAAQVTGSAIEVASLGEAFGHAVQLFSESNDKLGAQLQRIEGALGASLSRSDEQLAYYVAQAREVIDLSILSQRQIMEDLQALASKPAAVGALA